MKDRHNSTASEKIPYIPEHLLEEFLEFKIDLSEIPNVKKVKSVYLWSRENIERYRVNVWTEVEKNRNGDIIKGNSITYSFFVHYDRDEMMIKDKTKTLLEEIDYE